MGIFSSKKVVVGLFDNDAEVEQALNRLNEQGFNQENDVEISIIDENRVVEGMPIDKQGEGQGVAIPSVGTTAPTGNVFPVDEKEDPAVRSSSLETSARDVLTELGVDPDEIPFYARQVAGGSSLLVLKADKEQADQALSIMKQASLVQGETS